MRLLALLFIPLTLAAEPAETNVIFGMHSGLALLMDVYKPATSNGYGIVVIPGSGWHRPLGYDAPLLKSSKEFSEHTARLTAAGYTAFVITHRAAPRFRYPDAVDDARRAVRFVRHHAKGYGIRADRIGVLGASSGGHLACMLGTLDGKGESESPDPVERESSKVQCVVAFYPPTDLAKVNTPSGLVAVTSFMGMPAPRNLTANAVEAGRYREASPVNHVTPDDPPFLLIHGDNDRVVPFQQSEILQSALEKAGVAVKLIRVPGGDHGSNFPGSKDKEDWAGETAAWFQTHLGK
jgi:acetyl esterase/lipase